MVFAKLVVPRVSRVLGLLGVDVHKPTKPVVPEAGGLAILAGLLTGYMLLVVLDPTRSGIYTALALTAVTAWLVGLVDDLVKLDAVSKPLLSSIAAMPLIAMGVYTPYLHIPLAGDYRLTIVYPALIIVGVTVSANMFNMIDVLNGSMVLSAMTILVGLTIVHTLLFGGDLGELAALVLATTVLASYLPFNIYPARMFNGDQGSLMVGALVAALAIVYRVEAYYVIASLPLVLNGFQILASIRGLREHSEIVRPTRVVDGEGCIEASRDPRAPITLVQLITVRNCLCEPSIVAGIAILVGISSLLAIATAIAELLLAS
jgi:UDP-N-acetylglucosamine--dolichyl-phosphate N-acetylglucosaminephosphotransferase